MVERSSIITQNVFPPPGSPCLSPIHYFPHAYVRGTFPGQEESSEKLKMFLSKFGTLRTVDGGECTPDALFGKINSVVVAMIQEVSVSIRQQLMCISRRATCVKAGERRKSTSISDMVFKPTTPARCSLSRPIPPQPCRVPKKHMHLPRYLVPR